MSHRLCFAVVFLVCCVFGCSSNQSSTSTSSTGKAERSDGEPSAETILREVANYYSKADALQVSLMQTTSVNFQGTKNESTVEFGVLAQRPNRLAIRDKNSEAADFVSDGENLFTLVHQMKT
ncbi:MAG: DUF2092 domain-containing protein, partial [Pirellulaceae bacterium]|nr:DUF2092 domain-containing protein [Pirellulaceae bacterium]